MIVAVLAAVLLTAGYARQSVPTTAPAGGPAAAVDQVLADAVAHGDIPGVVAIVADSRAILYQGAFGLTGAGAGAPLTVDSVFRIGSMTKPITSVAAMQLVEQGRLRLDDAAEKYLPELAHLKVFQTFDARTGAYTVRPATRTLTVRQLLTHTSGLGGPFTSPVIRDFKPRPGEAYPVGPLLFEPGSEWVYGTSTEWAGRLVESLSGQALEAYFRDHIFRPLAMVDTFYNVPEDRHHRLVTVQRRRSDGAFEADPNQPSTSFTRFSGSGGLVSTAPDFMRFLQMFLNKGAAGGVRILSANTTALMGRNQIGRLGVRALKTAVPEYSCDFTFIDDGRDKWGLGFLITAGQQRGKRSAGSLSWAGIWNTYFWIDLKRGIAAVILMQYLPFADSKALAVYDAFERAVYQLPTVATR